MTIKLSICLGFMTGSNHMNQIVDYEAAFVIGPSHTLWYNDCQSHWESLITIVNHVMSFPVHQIVPQRCMYRADRSTDNRAICVGGAQARSWRLWNSQTHVIQPTSATNIPTPTKNIFQDVRRFTNSGCLRLLQQSNTRVSSQQGW